MEILRFEQVPESVPQRKKSSRGFLALGLVAALFGISTAFASSTIVINDANPVQLGQGVTAVTACDNAIGVNPVTALASDASRFFLYSIVVGTGAGDNRISSACSGKIFRVTLYTDGASPTTVPMCSDAAADSNDFSIVYQGALGSDFSAHKCYGGKAYFRMTKTISDAGSVTILYGGGNISAKTGFDLEQRPFGRIVLETISAENLPFANGGEGTDTYNFYKTLA
jgi:hypothetical protein